MTYQDKLDRNVNRTLLLGFFQVMLVFMPVAVPFFQSKGLSMQEVFSLQALFGLVVLITEVPSGYLADILGRKNTLVVGAVFAALGHSCLLFADGFWTLALFEALLGVSHSLVSGADLALLYDTELALKRGESQQRQVVGRLYGARSLSEALAGVLCTAVLLAWSYQELVYVQVVIGWIPVALALRLVEPPGQRLGSGESESSHMANLGHILRYLMSHSRILRLVFLALSVWCLTTFYAVWLLQKLWEQQGIELAHFGWLWAALTLLAAIAGRWAHQIERVFGTNPVLVFIGVAPALGYLGMDLFGTVGGLVAASTFFLARGLGLVVLRDALNKRVPSQFRATANSLASFGFRGAFVLTGPLVGYAFDLWGMSTTLWMLLVITLVIFAGLILPLMAAADSSRSSVEDGTSTDLDLNLENAQVARRS